MVTAAMKLKDARSLEEMTNLDMCIKKQRHFFVYKGPHSQSSGFSSTHVWIWQLDRKEGTCTLYLDAWKDWVQVEKGRREDEMVGWHHWLNGHEFEQAPGDGEGQGSLACCSPWCHKESDTTYWLNNNNSWWTQMNKKYEQTELNYRLKGSYSTSSEIYYRDSKKV